MNSSLPLLAPAIRGKSTNTDVIAVLRGRHVENCLFFQWDDAAAEIIGCPWAQWKVFAQSNIADAVSYCTSNIRNTTHHYINHKHAGKIKTVEQEPHVSRTVTTTAQHTTGPALGNVHVRAESERVCHQQENHDLSEPAIVSATAQTSADEDIIDQDDVVSFSPSGNNDQESAVALSSSSSSSSSSCSLASSSSSAPAQKRKRCHDKNQQSSPVVLDKPPSKPWLSMFRALEQHKEQSGGSLDIDPKDDSKHALRSWVRQQRHQYSLFQTPSKRSYMTQTKIQMLTDLGFNFFSDDSNQSINNNSKPGLGPMAKTEKNSKRWDNMFASLQKYKEVHGTVDVVKDPENVQLYSWIQAQRAEYKKLTDGEDSKLSATRIKKLLDMGFTFAKRPKYFKWSDRIEQLKQYKAKHGHLKIPLNDPELGEFASKQRVDYARYLEGKKDTRMNAAREKQLLELGFVFSHGKRISEEKKSKPKKSWDERYQDLLDFKAKHGHTMVPQHSECGLGQWVHQQRKNYRKLKEGQKRALTTEKALKLSDAGFIFDTSNYRKAKKSLDTECNDDDDEDDNDDDHDDERQLFSSIEEF